MNALHTNIDIVQKPFVEIKSEMQKNEILEVQQFLYNIFPSTVKNINFNFHIKWFMVFHLFHRFFKRFELPLLAQSLVMNITMFLMIHLCVKTKRNNSILKTRERVFTGKFHSFCSNNDSPMYPYYLAAAIKRH